MRRYLRIAMAAIFAVALSLPARADVIWNVPGYLDFPPDPPGPLVDYLEAYGMKPGQLLDFQLTIDTDAPDLCESPDVGLYRAATLTFTWNGHVGASTEPFYIERSFHSVVGRCAFDPDNTMLLRAPVTGEGIPFGWVIMLWPSAVPGDDLLLIPPPAGSFHISILNPLGSDWSGFLGPATVVPEPATLLLVSGGLAAIRAVRRRRR
jgi:PEP-CTERM motif